jgi:hypothetical protein
LHILIFIDFLIETGRRNIFNRVIRSNPRI